MERDAACFGCVPFLYLHRSLATECQRPEEVSLAEAEEVVVPLVIV